MWNEHVTTHERQEVLLIEAVGNSLDEGCQLTGNLLPRLIIVHVEVDAIHLHCHLPGPLLLAEAGRQAICLR
eukprot:9978519-Lingulodinium_polyedra.AAC.1